MEKVPIETDFIKLGAFLKLSGTAETGGQAKNLVLKGIVKVNRSTCLIRGKKIFVGDIVQIKEQEYEVIKSAGNKTPF